jgi:acetyl-CoA carboxylase biotin carboxyl carrier protein
MSSWFDLEEIDLEQVLASLAGSDVTYFRLRVGETELVFTTETGAPPGAPGAPPPERTSTFVDAPADPEPPAGASPGGLAADVGTTGVPPDGESAAEHVVCSPMAGRFHRSPSPGAPPYVEPGDEVVEESTVGLVESMKIFTAVRAGARGVVLDVLGGNGQLVAQGEPLVRVRPGDVSGPRPERVPS